MLLLSGTEVSKHRLSILKEKISDSSLKLSLVVVRVGDDPASKVYVGKKKKSCLDIGIGSQEIHLQNSVSEAELIEQVRSLNQDRKVTGILVQLPLPSHIDSNKVIESIDPLKDVDGFHPYNLGRMLANEARLLPCTPLGVMNLLEHYDISVKGKRAVVIGRSKIVGRPMSILLDQAGATVSVVHRGTLQPESYTREADILVAAAGNPEFIGKDAVKKSAICIDVGIHRKADSKKLVGDLRFEELQNHVAAITPVPGGVGPMTICSLLENTVRAFELQNS